MPTEKKGNVHQDPNKVGHRESEKNVNPDPHKKGHEKEHEQTEKRSK